MNKIIVTGVDSSQTALTAAEKAAELASGLGGELYVFSAYSISATATVQSAKAGNRASATSEAYRKLTDGQAVAAQKVAESVAEIIHESFPDLTVKPYAVEGIPADVLVQAATRLDADTIVVGNKRPQGFSRILGSVARNVAAGVTCDLYIVNTTRK